MAFERDKQLDYNDAYDEAESQWSNWLPEAYKDESFYLGRQWSDEEIKSLDEENRKPVVYNKVRRNVKLVTGYQRRNRLSSVIKPQENTDQALADVWGDLLTWAYRVSHGHYFISQAFKDAIIPGISLINPYMDFTNDLVNGDPKVMIEHYSSFLLDPKFTDQTLVDCNYLMRRRYLSRNEAMMLLPDQAKDISSLKAGVGEKDRKFPYLPYDNNMRDNLFAYDEFWQRTQKEVKTLIEKPTGRTMKWSGTEEELKEFVGRFPFFKVVSTYEPTVERTIFLQDIVMDHEIDPYGISDYPFVPILGDYQPNYDDYRYKLQGVVRPQRDPQVEFNKLRMSMTDISRSQANSGWIYELGTVGNPEDLGKTGQGVVIAMNKGHAPGSIQKIPAGEIPQSLPALADAVSRDIQEDAGISDELLGMGEMGNTQISGTLAKERAYNSVTTLQDIFDGLNFSQRLLTEKMLKMIQANFTPEKVSRITEKEIPANFFSLDISNYDISVEEGLLTDTQKSAHYVQLMQAKAAGINIPESAIIKALPIQNKAELLEAYEQEAEQSKKQEAEMQEHKELELRLGNARVIKELSLAEQERRRGVADEKLAVWRESEASMNASKADLNRVEAIKKIQEMDIKNVMGLLDVMQRMQQQDNLEGRVSVKQDIAQVNQSVAQQDAKATETADQAYQDIPPELLQALQGQQQQGQQL